MDEVERLDGVAPVDDGGDVDLGSTLRDHLDVDVALGESTDEEEGGELAAEMREEGRNSPEHLARDSDHVLHVLADQREDAHIAVDGNLDAQESASDPGCSGNASDDSPRRQSEVPSSCDP